MRQGRRLEWQTVHIALVSSLVNEFMNNPSRKIQWLVWGGLVLVAGVVGAAFVRSEIAGPDAPLPVIGQIPDFHLTNQNNQAVSMADLRGKVWVADIIFTRCPGPCRTITGNV